jgi:hypothetical protein
MPKPSTDPTPEDLSDVDILGMADALNISAEDRGLFKSSNEDNKEDEVPETPEGENEGTEEEVVSEEEKSDEADADPEKEKDEESDEKEGEEKDKEDKKGDEEEEEETSGVQKRINKLTARNKEYESQIETLKTEMEELKSKVSTTTPKAATSDPNIPLADVFDLNGLNQARENALEVKEWALSNPDGGSYKVVKDGKEEEILVTKEQATKLLVNASRMLDRDIPKRRQYLEEAQGNWVEARRAYPQAFDEKHPDSKQAGAMAELFPQIKQFPDWPLLILDMLAGQKMRLAALKSKPADTKGKVVNFPNGKAPKVIGSPQSQSGPKTRVVKTVSDVAKVKNDISEAEAADLLSSFM